jgi:ELWxxDGT repeat protein
MKNLKIKILLLAFGFLALPGFSKAAEPYLVKDIFSGSTASNPQNLIDLNGTLFFSATDATNGIELWKSDGTSSGTVLVKDINPGVSGSNPRNLVVYNDAIYFSANDGTHGFELWKSDGTESGTVLLKDINPTTDSMPGNFKILNGTLYFFANIESSSNEYHLWKTDGTEAGTVDTGIFGSNNDQFSINNNCFTDITGINAIGVYENKMYLCGTGLSYNAESDYYAQYNYLIATNGTLAGTTRIKEIGGESADIVMGNFLVFKNNLYFQASDGVNGAELWKSNGTEAGTGLLKDIWAGPSSSGPMNFFSDGNFLYFIANNGINGKEYFKSDGTEAGTNILKDIRSGVSSGAPAGQLFFGFSYTGTISRMLLFDNSIYFFANDIINGNELWKTDGTEQGTILYKDIFAGASGSSPYFLTAFKGGIYFSANNGTNGTELMAIEFTSPSTPNNFFSHSQATTSITLAWEASTDNMGILGYRIYKNGTLLTTTSNLTYTDTELASDTQYSYTVSALDLSQNESVQSSSLAVSTKKLLTLTYSADQNGIITGNATQSIESNADGTEVMAVPNEGYAFLAWSDNSIQNPRQDKNVTADISVVANFTALETAPKAIITPTETPTSQKAKIDSYKIYQTSPTKNCQNRIKIEIQGKNFDKDAKIEIGDSEAKDTNKKDSKNISATFCLDKMLASLTKNPNKSSKKELSITNPDADKETADKKIDLNNLKYSFKKTNLNTNTKEGIKNIQTLLYQKGYLKNLLYITGNYGEITKEAVRNFQKDKGLPVIGLLDAKTLKKLSS